MRSRAFDPVDLDLALRQCGFVATHRQLREMGLSTATITRRIAPHGPWQRMLPGVVLAHRGRAGRREQLLAALAFAGPDGVVTGLDALSAHGLRSIEPGPAVEVLVPMHCQRKSRQFVSIERTRNLPAPDPIRGIRYAPAPRALMDSCRRVGQLHSVRHLVSSAVQAELVSVQQLLDELHRAARQRTALARLVLNEVGEGIRSVAEAVARDVMQQGGIPTPQWNVTLYGDDGQLLLSPDAYWADLGVALEIDSFAWHLDPKSYLRTLKRSRAMMVNGIIVLHFAPVEIRDDPERFVREVLAVLRIAAGRPAPSGIAVRAAA